jgi:hypothetical protein
MAENKDLVKCPLCQGHGELRRLEMAERLADADLPKKLETCLAELTEPAATTSDSQPRSFVREVHTWNPRLPIWRRSPKE